MCSVEKRDNLWILTITGDDQNRLNPTLIDSLLSTLTNLTSQYTPGSVLITTGKGKFFSNGFDLPWARAAGSKTAAALRLQSMMGIVDSAHDSAETTVEAAVRLGEQLAEKKWVGEVYAEIRKSLYPDACKVLGLTPKPLVSKI
ncbi:hypothetical protein RYX36_001019 [Vicia faba]